MTKVHTFIFYSQELKNTISIEIYTAPVKEGYFNVDANHAIVSPEMYSQFRSCKTQAEQRKFFDALKRVSSNLLI